MPATIPRKGGTVGINGDILLNAKGEKIKPGKIVKNNEPYKKIKNYTIVNGKVVIRFHMFFFVTPSFEK